MQATAPTALRLRLVRLRYGLHHSRLSAGRCSVTVKIALVPDGAALAWTEEGRGEPLLLIAGQATAMDGWGPPAEALAEHFRVIRFDHRGIGGSSNGDADRYTTRLLAADAAAVLEAARVDSAPRVQPFHGREDRPVARH
ncbi:alpha/beta fold hydrolase [Arthrobacter sp. ISL-69]|uniref:alpha/beta fold hydrolase n=1 Tax=Arthrobacter sp. ISL-69 TaxID=2819113 RepID=UPI0037C04179